MQRPSATINAGGYGSRLSVRFRSLGRDDDGGSSLAQIRRGEEDPRDAVGFHRLPFVDKAFSASVYPPIAASIQE
jgi:hypothetical protein